MFKDTIDPKKERKFEAYIGLERSWWDYYRHYKTAVDYIVEGVEGNVPINTISLPLIYLVRHSLELAFKANILRLEKVSNARPPLKLKTHNLEELFSILHHHLEFIIEHHNIPADLVKRIKYDLSNAEKLKHFFHAMDIGSHSFRYPVDKLNNPNFESSLKLNIAEITKTFYSFQPFFYFLDTALEEFGVFKSNNV